ncbi:hypothetical protein ACNI3T_00760 [Christiangramia sp. ASW11-125]|uniref:hypothetical protein n=1 Tax=Christiangramia sp. ASW11-125 TaxID=3400701 RepID=UPI003AB09C18
MEALKLDETFQNKLPPDKKAGFLKLLDFLRTTFINDSSQELSAAIAYNFLFANHNFRTDILMYPSVQTQLTAMNMAIHPNFVDNQLQLKRLYFVKMINFNEKEKTYNLSFGNYGVVEKNVIMWKQRKKVDPLFDKLFALDLKEYFRNK